MRFDLKILNLDFVAISNHEVVLPCEDQHEDENDSQSVSEQATEQFQNKLINPQFEG